MVSAGKCEEGNGKYKRCTCISGSDHQEYYEKNYQTYAKKLDDLDAEYQEKLSDVKTRDVIAAHQAFGYLCQAYGLNQSGIRRIIRRFRTGCSPDEGDCGFAKKHQVKTIFFEELVSPKISETIAKEIGAQTKDVKSH